MNIGRVALASTVALLGIVRAFGVTSVDFTCLGFFVLAVGILLLDEFQEFSFGKDGFSFKRRAKEALEALGVGGKPSKAAASVESPPALREIGERLDDPNKGQFGGSPSANGKRLSARVEPYPGVKEWFFIRLVVESIDATKPLSGKVTFYLHPTFKTPSVTRMVAEGQAVLETVAWGAFTVGVKCDDGTLLELDLSEMPNVPITFAQR